MYEVHIPLSMGGGGWGVSHYLQWNIPILRTNTHKADKWVKTNMVHSQGQYLDYVSNIEVKLPYCVSREIWVSASYPFLATFSPPSVGR